MQPSQQCQVVAGGVDAGSCAGVAGVIAPGYKGCANLRALKLRALFVKTR